MTRTVGVLFLLAALVVPVAGQPPAKAPGRFLDVDVVALDRNGMPIDDLRRDELEVWIGGLRIPTDTFIKVSPTEDPERARRTIVLLLDDVTLSPMGVSRTREVARRFVNRLVPGESMIVMTLSGGGGKASSERSELLRAVDAYNVRASGFMRPDELSAHVLNTITSISRQVAEAPGRRKVIVAIGASWLFDTPIPPPNAARPVDKELTEALRAMAAANVTLYVVDPGGVGMSPVLGGGNGFARDTGGYAFTNSNDAFAAVERIMRETSTYYIVRIEDPPVFKTHELRDLEVRTKRRGVSVRARRAIIGRL
jgi:VWFA-related protein